MAKQQNTEDIYAEIDRLEELKSQAIEQLLADRQAIDERLQRYGYTEPKAVKAPSGKKRTRRTKAQIAADEAAGKE